MSKSIPFQPDSCVDKGFFELNYNLSYQRKTDDG